MNVNPATAPLAVSTGQIASRAGDRQTSSQASGSATPSQRVSAEGRARQDDHQKAEQLRAYIANANMTLSTYHDENSGRSILEVRDQVTGDLVTQYPSEELIRLYTALRQTIVDQNV